MSVAFIFPGQGSQYVGMGKDLAGAFPEAKRVFEEVDDALGEPLSRLMFEGPEEDLNLTENTQPALMAASMAVVNVLKFHAGIRLENVCAFAAGHSLGEYSALTATGALELAATAKLNRVRGQAMQKAVPVGEGSMAAILGPDFETVKAITKEAAERAGKDRVCQIANDNCPGQIVISGHADAVEIAIQMASEAGAKKAVMLPVSAPFHCTLMAPAAQKMSFALADTDIRPPCVPVVANVTAKGESEPADLRRLLVDQITGIVRWRESVQWMKEQGVTEIVEIGPGKVLCGLVRRIDRDIVTSCAGTVEEVEALMKKLA